MSKRVSRSTTSATDSCDKDSMPISNPIGGKVISQRGKSAVNNSNNSRQSSKIKNSQEWHVTRLLSQCGRQRLQPPTYNPKTLTMTVHRSWEGVLVTVIGTLIAPYRAVRISGGQAVSLGLATGCRAQSTWLSRRMQTSLLTLMWHQ